MGALVGAAPERVVAQELPFAGGLELWGGLSNKSPQWGMFGETPDMSLGILALRWSRSVGARPRDGELPALEWTVDLIPLARLSPSLVSLRGTGFQCAAALCVLRADPSVRSGRFPPGSPIGFGLSPLGLTRRFHRASVVSPFVGVAGGFLRFSERVPTTKAATFNFTASAELGLRLGPPDEPAVTIAYRFHHLSNAGTAGENPGVASHLITVGVHRTRRSRATSPARPSP